MKYLWILFFMSSCAFYCDTYELEIGELSQGKIILSSNSIYKEVCIEKSTVKIEVNKYEDIFISYYSYFNGSFTRFPLGCYLKTGKTKVNFDKKLGILTQAANENHFNSVFIDFDEMVSLISFLKNKWDPWILKKEEIKMVLKGDIKISSLTAKSKFKLDNLNYLFNWKSENSCLTYWYPMIISFSNNSGDIYNLNIKDDGSYVGFYRR